MADNNPNISPYPLMFDPSQWSNKYSNYAGQSLSPYMGGMSGTPTDAHGNPIGSYEAFLAQQAAPAQPAAAPAAAQGTTLNSSPLQPATVPQGLSQPGMGAPSVQGGMQAWGAATPAQRAAAMPQAVYGTTGGNADKGSFGGLGPSGFVQGSGVGGQGQAAAPAAPAAQAPDMGQAYLTALSNPGKVTTPGATVPQAALPSNQSGVLQQFLQNWQNKGSPTTGAGNYNNAGFFSALQGAQPSA
jgi:hypothetical protein